MKKDIENAIDALWAVWETATSEKAMDCIVDCISILNGKLENDEQQH